MSGKRFTAECWSGSFDRRGRDRSYSIFTSALNINLTLKWLFPQEKATFHAAVVSICEVKNALEHFWELCRPGLHWYPTHFRNKRGNGWGKGVYSKSENALRTVVVCAPP